MRISSRVPTTQQLRTHEQLWIKACHPHWGAVLMELAGHKAAEVALSMWEQNPGPVIIFCGPGNNGGDGFVVARYLHMCGAPVTVHLIKSTSEPRIESSINRGIIDQLQIPAMEIDTKNVGSIEATLEEAVLVVDALLGTGLDRPVEGVYASIIKAVNASGKPVLALDIPSGIHSDSGAIMGAAVEAQQTVTFGYLKSGLLCHPGADYAGHLHIADIGLPGLDYAEHNSKPMWHLSTADKIADLLPSRKDSAHKGDFGHVLTIAGSPGMSGASMLASKSALRSGAGLSILATAKSLLLELPAQEVIYKALEESKGGSISANSLKTLQPELDKATSVVLGPGLSMDDDTVSFVHSVLKAIKKPCVIDADGLNAISKDTSTFPKAADNFVLTPHPKELARLMGVETAEIQHDRMKSAMDAAHKFGCVVVLKGSRTVIASPAQEAYINPTGNSGMATAGAGDVLSGIIGGLLSQGLTPFAAAISGAYLHGAAGDLAAQEIGEAGLVAGDIMNYVPLVMQQIRSGIFQGSFLEQELFGN